MPKFTQKNGLTAYALACGDIQRVEFTRPSYGSYVRIDLWHEGGSVYQVRAYDSQNADREWCSYESLGEARKIWAGMVRARFCVALPAIKRDKRYSVSLELNERAEPQWVARFCGDRIGKYTTREAAWIRGCYQDRINRTGE